MTTLCFTKQYKYQRQAQIDSFLHQITTIPTMATFPYFSECVLETPCCPEISSIGYRPFPYEKQENMNTIIEDTPYYILRRRLVAGSSFFQRHVLIQDYIKYKFSKTQLKTMVRERGLLNLGRNGKSSFTWLSNANMWELSMNLKNDFDMRQQFSSIIYLVLRRNNLSYDLIDMIIKIVVADKRARIKKTITEE